MKVNKKKSYIKPLAFSIFIDAPMLLSDSEKEGNHEGIGGGEEGNEDEGGV